jgi:nucleotide-binding universal stress UspA family protein
VSTLGELGVYHILLPTDLSGHTARAADMARAAGGRITLFHVIETVCGVTYDEFAPFCRELEARASAHLIALAPRFEGSGADVARTVVYGKPADEIVRFAVDNQSISSCWRHTRWICRALVRAGAH